MAYRYLGYGITNDKGIAKLEFDENGDPLTHSYTGTGAGEIDIVASLDDSTKISEGSLQSKTYSVLDGYWYDDGISNPKKVNWYTPSTNFTVQIDSDGTLLTSTSTSPLHYWANNYTQISIGAFAIEFDLVSYNTNNESGIRLNGTNSHSIYFGEVNCPQNCHFKLIVDGTKIKYQIDNGVIVDFVTTTNTDFYVGFRFATATDMKYKNFKIYPI